jgi:hypothetical protein
VSDTREKYAALRDKLSAAIPLKKPLFFLPDVQ